LLDHDDGALHVPVHLVRRRWARRCHHYSAGRLRIGGGSRTRTHHLRRGAAPAMGEPVAGQESRMIGDRFQVASPQVEVDDFEVARESDRTRRVVIGGVWTTLRYGLLLVYMFICI